MLKHYILFTQFNKALHVYKTYCKLLFGIFDGNEKNKDFVAVK